MTATHTPGPWKATELDSGLWNVHAADRPVKPPIAALDFSPGDASLISAAPELLEVLEAILHHVPRFKRAVKGRDANPVQYDSIYALIPKARAVIQKARGAE